ncbi:MAG: DUF58 domain-containing protein [Magnetococcales bacterium]|nr:DUF58 domain-containing protein [Magnetococcales bacterium]
MISLLHRWRLSKATRTLDSDKPVHLTLGNLYIFPELSGLGFAVTSVIMIIGFLNFAINPAILMGCLLGSLLWVSLIHTHRNLLGLQVSAAPVTPVFAGDLAHIGLWIRESGQRPRYGLSLKVPSVRVSSTPVDLATGALGLISVPFPTSRRGLLQPGRLTLYSHYPLGLMRVWTHAKLARPILVYPRPEARTVYPQSREGHSRYGEQGPGTQGDDFAGLTPWQPGDSPKSVHWKASVQQSSLVVKRFGGSIPEKNWLRWEDAGLSEREAVLSRLCRWVLDAEAGQTPYGLEIPGVTIIPGHGLDHARRCLEALALFPGS